MKLVTRRWILGVGTALLVGGWGMTRYAHERLMTYPSDIGQRDRHSRQWAWDDSSGIFAGGVVMMTLGAGTIAFAIPRPRDRSDGRTE